MNPLQNAGYSAGPYSGPRAGVAPTAEQVFCNHRVPGSNPGTGSTWDFPARSNTASGGNGCGFGT